MLGKGRRGRRERKEEDKDERAEKEEEEEMQMEATEELQTGGHKVCVYRKEEIFFNATWRFCMWYRK